MNQREKILAATTVGVIGLVFTYFGYKRVQEGFQLKEKEIASLKSKVRKNDDIIFEGSQADQHLRALAARSLPSNFSRASTEYRQWLIELGQQNEILELEVQQKDKKDEKGVYRSQSFTLKGKGDLQQLVELLYAFYEKDYLHRLSKLSIAPVPNSPTLMTISLETDALSLLNAAPNQPVPKTLSNRLTKSLEDYSNVILERNIFAPTNTPPKVKSSDTVKIAKGEVLRHQIGAKDPEGTQVRYVLLNEPPKGLKLDSGDITWEPKTVGDYELKIAISDSGIPRQSVTQTLKISVVDPPPPAPVKEEKKFDIATQASVTAFLAGGSRPEIWINSKIESRVLYLKVGDNLELGSVKGKIVSIGANYAEFETDGKRWTVSDNDKNLAEAFKRMELN